MSNVYKNESITINDNKTLTAQWKIKNYTYNLVTNGGTLATEASEKGSKDHSFSGGDKLPNISRTGYSFGGWYTSPNFSGTAVTAFQNENATYYAKWTPVTYTITFSVGEPTGSTAYFKYGSLSVIYDNLPLTLGSPVADCYKFGGWHTSSASGTANIVTEITKDNFSNIFGSATSITLTASWIAQDTTVTEEIYRQSNNDDITAYEIIQVKQISYKTGSTYVRSDVTVDGCSENTTMENIEETVSKNMVVKRYFKRNTHEAKLLMLSTYGTYDGEGTVETDGSSTISFNYSDTETPLPAVTSNDGYTFLTWRDENDKAVTSIPAYCDKDRTYYATFSQKAPVEGKNYKVISSYDDGSDGNTTYIDRISTSLNCIERTFNNNRLELSKSTYNSSTITSTQYAQLYFPAITGSDSRTYVEASEVVNVPIKFARAAPTISDSTFTCTSTTIEPLLSGLEIVESDGTTEDVDSGATLTPPLKYYDFRYKETYMYNASATTRVTCTNVSTQDAPVIGDGNITYTKSTYTAKGIITIPYSNLKVQNDTVTLQYKEGEGNAWLTVTKSSTNTSVELSVDDGTIYFRYNSYTNGSTTYAASDSVSLVMERATVDINVTTNSTTYPTKSGSGLSDKTFTVKSGSQLSTNKEYIEWAENVALFGYTQAVPRGTSFLKNNNTSYNEANIITSALTLSTVWNAIKTSGFSYLKDVMVKYNDVDDDTKDLELASGSTIDFTYGKDTSISWKKDFNLNTFGDGSKLALLNYLDEHPGYFPGDCNSILYSQDDGKTWKSMNLSDSVINNGTTTLTATTTPVNTVDYEEFCTKFKPVYALATATNNASAAFTFQNATDGLCTVTLTDADKYTKYVLDIDSKTIDFYSNDDDRISGAVSITSTTFTIDLGEGRADNKLTVMFHSTLELPARKYANVNINKVTFSGEASEVFTISGNSIEPNTTNGWSMNE